MTVWYSGIKKVRFQSAAVPPVSQDISIDRVAPVVDDRGPRDESEHRVWHHGEVGDRGRHRPHHEEDSVDGLVALHVLARVRLRVLRQKAVDEQVPVRLRQYASGRRQGCEAAGQDGALIFGAPPASG